MTTPKTPKGPGSKYIESTSLVSPTGSKLVVRRIRLTRTGRDALTTQSEGIPDRASKSFRTKEQFEPA